MNAECRMPNDGVYESRRRGRIFLPASGFRRFAPRAAFTLVELLVVMAIIGMLSGVVLTTVAQVRHAARRAQAREHINQLATAWKSYLADNRKFPAIAVDEVNTQVMTLLNGNDKTHNPEGLKYMEFSGPDLTRGAFLDPWGNAYRVAVDNGLGLLNEDGTGYNSIVRPEGHGDVRQYVAAWSRGPDGVNGTKDDLKSW